MHVSLRTYVTYSSGSVPVVLGLRPYKEYLLVIVMPFPIKHRYMIDILNHVLSSYNDLQWQPIIVLILTKIVYDHVVLALWYMWS